ncbi:uncharacterized protein LOC110854730 [Folsomia candida]|uniref:Uncharacterized protein n=1 Tax=Folsomia candida TaxID=158441 RepID=A0A226DYJ8_FOLCA|nr:uncharacterized protein LOC110854730 [Folsomia candida]OXA49874.1 hypothetical protein Fcan01_15922 [Folsomia candida]
MDAKVEMDQATAEKIIVVQADAAKVVAQADAEKLVDGAELVAMVDGAEGEIIAEVDAAAKAALDNKANQCNPNHGPTGKDRAAGYEGKGDEADLDNHANQLNPNQKE